MEGDDESLLSSLEQAVQSHPDDPSHHFNLGLFLWGKGGKDWREKAAEQFMVSARLNPLHWEAFRYLGDYYTELDTNRALKCYQRAVSLHPEDSHSGEALCNLLDKEGKVSLEFSVCREASAKSPRAFWALRRLGYLLVHQNKWSDAVQSLQNAIRGYPTCADLWEALGLAYQRLGMYTAAIKSYGRALDLEDSRVFAMIESGNIFLMLGSPRKGIESFRMALTVYPKNVSALYGLASALLALSKECLDTGAFIWAASVLEEAAEYVESISKLVANMSCIWKLDGDIQFTLAKYSPWMGSEEILGNSQKSLAASISAWRKMRSLAVEHSKCSYQRALHLAPWQANIYTDIAISMDLSFSLDECCKLDSNSRQLPEKMMLGSLLLEGNNYDFWVALGILSEQRALKQHAFIRGLQLDVSLAVAWAYLGKLYREEGDLQLARHAFDRARSIDPSLSLPWAGMSADIQARDPASDEAYESCLRAVQTMPLAEFQIALAQLALHFGQMLAPQVLAASRQAVQQAPYYPEAHNLNGLISEAHDDYKTAIASYRLTRLALEAYNSPSLKWHFSEVTINLARVLCKAGYVHDAIRELDLLKEGGLLDVEGLQLHAISLWQAGRNDLSLSAVRELAQRISSTGPSFSFDAITFICRILYSISGLGSAINSISKMPKEFFHSAKVSYVVSAINALDQGNHLESVMSCSRNFLSTHEEVMEMHLLVALTKMVKLGPNLELQNGLRHLRKVLHMFPNCIPIRNSLGYFLLSSGLGEISHLANRCYSISLDSSHEGGLKTSHEILGAEAIACHSSVNCKFVYTSSTCKNSAKQRAKTFPQMQRWLHQEPWNINARYLLTLTLLQKARDERYPLHILAMLKQIIPAALSSEFYEKKSMYSQYQKFQLLLCASETFLQGGNITTSFSLAKDASNLPLPNEYLFFAHLQLCRVCSAKGDRIILKQQMLRCLNLRTDYPIGWICLKFIESQYDLQFDENVLADGLDDSLKNCGKSSNMWKALYKLASGLASYHAQDYLKAESFMAEACSWAGSESGLYLCHGAISMELARKVGESKYVTSALKSLRKVVEISSSPLPYVSLLLAQAEASLGSKAKWERNLQLEWLSWPSENKPAELYFQMHLLAKQTTDQSSSCGGYGCPEKWVLRAIHLNPSCSRYWRTLYKLIE